MNAVTPGAAQVTHIILPNASTTGLGSEQSMPWQQIMPLLNGLQPGQFTEAAQSFLALGQALETIRGKMQAQGEALAANKSWTGSAAQAAMNQFQQLHDQAAALSQQATQTGQAIHWFGTEATPPFQAIQPPQVMSQTASDILAGGIVAASSGTGIAQAAGALGLHSDGQAKADQAARGYMAAYNQQIAKLNQALPHTISGSSVGSQSFSAPPGNHSGTGTGSSAAGSGYGGVGGTNGTGGTGGTGGVPGYAPSSGMNPFNASKLPSGSAGPTASLQGYAPPPSGTTTSPFGGGPTPPAATGVSRQPVRSGTGDARRALRLRRCRRRRRERTGQGRCPRRKRRPRRRRPRKRRGRGERPRGRGPGRRGRRSRRRGSGGRGRGRGCGSRSQRRGHGRDAPSRRRRHHH